MSWVKKFELKKTSLLQFSGNDKLFYMKDDTIYGITLSDQKPFYSFKPDYQIYNFLVSETRILIIEKFHNKEYKNIEFETEENEPKVILRQEIYEYRYHLYYLKNHELILEFTNKEIYPTTLSEEYFLTPSKIIKPDNQIVKFENINVANYYDFKEKEKDLVILDKYLYCDQKKEFINTESNGDNIKINNRIYAIYGYDGHFFRIGIVLEHSIESKNLKKKEKKPIKINDFPDINITINCIKFPNNNFESKKLFFIKDNKLFEFELINNIYELSKFEKFNHDINDITNDCKWLLTTGKEISDKLLYHYEEKADSNLEKFARSMILSVMHSGDLTVIDKNEKKENYSQNLLFNLFPLIKISLEETKEKEFILENFTIEQLDQLLKEIASKSEITESTLYDYLS